MLLLLLLFAAVHALPIHLSRRTVDPDTLERRSTPTMPTRGVYVVQFQSAVDTTLIRRMTAVLGYTPTEYVPINSVMVFVKDAAIGERFIASLAADIRHIEHLQRSDRHADMGAVLETLAVRPENNEYRATRGKGAVLIDRDSNGPEHVRLRVRTFYNVLTHDADDSDADDEERVTRYVSQLTNAMSTMSGSPKPHVDRKAKAITIDDVQIDEAEAASEAIVDQIDDVYWVEALPAYEPLNAWSVPAVHRAADGNRVVAPLTSQSAPWQPLLGLRGANQTIAISDTSRGQL